MGKPIINIALPVMDESSALPGVLNALFLQTIVDFRLFICVNQPDEWWQNPAKRRICLENSGTLNFLRSLKDQRLIIIDKSSPGLGWTGKAHGIGWARKTLMDRISAISQPYDIIISLDADTVFGPRYLESILENILVKPDAVAFSIPYYHRLTSDEELDRAMLRYEIYMRAYAINLWRIKSPYCFTALGSAIALPVWAYRAIGGITPKLSGEDFYFLQKLVKFGLLVHWNGEMVYPAARLSERVFFGTGPALIKGIGGDWESYPVYRMKLYSAISDLYKLLPLLFEKNVPSPLDDFLESLSGGIPWDTLRKNSRTSEQFIRACHEKVDGLRILQYLKEQNKLYPYSNESAVLELLATIHKEQEIKPDGNIPEPFTFENSPISLIDDIRNALTKSEMSYRKQHWTVVTGLNAIFN